MNDPLSWFLGKIAEREADFEFHHNYGNNVLYQQQCDTSDGGVKILRDGRDRGLWVKLDTVLHEDMVLLTWDEVGMLGKWLTEQHKAAKKRDNYYAKRPLKRDPDDLNGPTNNPITNPEDRKTDD